jgi:hypothetical protein
MSRLFLPLSLSLSLALACNGSDSNGRSDGGPSDRDAAPSGIATPPAAAALPKLVDWTCPKGWNQRTVAQKTAAEHRICEPPKLSDCKAGTAQWLGEAACQTIGSPCPAGDFLGSQDIRALAPGFKGAILHVKGGATGGDGTAAKPFGTVAEALGAAKAGDIVHLAAATHDGSVTLSKSVALVGACVEKTIVSSSSTVASATVQITAAGSRLANLAVTGIKGGVLVGAPSGAVSVGQVEISGTASFALMMLPSTVTLELSGVAARDIAGPGLALGEGAVIKGDRLSFERLEGYGVLVGAGGTGKPPPQVTLKSLAVRDVAESSQPNGAAVRMEAPGTLKIEGCLFQRANNIAVTLVKASVLELESCVIRDTQPGSLKQGRALVVFDGAAATLRRVLSEGNRVTALHAWGSTEAGPAPKIALEDVVVRDTKANVDTGIVGCALVAAGEITGTRVLLEASTDAAVLVGADKPVARKKLELSDVAILDTRPRPKDKYRGAALVMAGGEVTLKRALIEKARSHGIVAGLSVKGEPGPRLTLEDLTIRDVLPDASHGKYGRGLELQGATVTLRRAVLERNHDIAALLSSSTEGSATPTTAEIEDLLIQDTKSGTKITFSGLGLVVQKGSDARVRRMVARRNHAVGLLAIQDDGPEGKLDLADIVLQETARSACAAIPEGRPHSCVKGGVVSGGGTGLALIGKVSATISRFDIYKNVLCGIQVVGGATLSAREGELHGNAIGVNAGKGIDLNQLLDPSVRLYDNDTNLDSSALPLPSVAETLQGLF